jgi:hypothetical protein
MNSFVMAAAPGTVAFPALNGKHLDENDNYLGCTCNIIRLFKFKEIFSKYLG